MSDSAPASSAPRSGFRLLDIVETIGNRLPDPITLFAVGAVLVMIVSHVANKAEWRVHHLKPVVQTTSDTEGAESSKENPKVKWEETDTVEEAKSLLTKDGLFWAFKGMVKNFAEFPPLGIVLVGMLGIGVAELTGLIPAVLKVFMLIVPPKLLTPAVVFIGIMSSMTLDAGYVVLPPLAAAMYQASGRSPLAGIVASFAGVSAGFNANLFLTALDPLLAGFSSQGAEIIVPGYQVAPTCNWAFMIVSTITMTLAGWFATAFFIERRFAGKPPEEGGPAIISDEALKSQHLTDVEKKGLLVALFTTCFVGAIYGLSIGWEHGALHGEGGHFARWVETIVPTIFFVFLLPGVAYGICTGVVRSDKELSKLFAKTMATMAPIIVLSFFAAQFIAYFRYSNLDRMLAMSGGQMLTRADMSPMVLIIVFILVTAIFNLFVGSMSAKYLMFAPIFVPMFMMVGISPELTQVAYRIGDSITNIITPLNAYLIIVLAYLQKYVPKAGMGTLISSMVPYTVTFGVVWIIQLVIWMLLGVDLGPDGALWFEPSTIAN